MCFHVFLVSVVDASYEASGKHTFVPMSIMNGTLVLMLVAFAVLYKELAPRTHAVSGEKSEENAAIIKSKSKGYIQGRAVGVHQHHYVFLPEVNALIYAALCVMC